MWKYEAEKRNGLCSESETRYDATGIAISWTAIRRRAAPGEGPRKSPACWDRETDLDLITGLLLAELVTHSDRDSLQPESIRNRESVNLLLKGHL